MTDLSKAISLAGDLMAVRAHRGAAQVLFNAQIQAATHELRQWTPNGPLPLRPRPVVANDHLAVLHSTL